MRLLGRDGAEFNPLNKKGLRPLARLCGEYVRTVKALLGCSGVKVNLRDREGGSRLSLIGEAGCEDVLGIMLGTGRGNVDPNPAEGDR